MQIGGTLYCVVYVFATYVIGGQFAAVKNEILKESGVLKDLILFSKGLQENRQTRSFALSAPMRARSRNRSGECFQEVSPPTAPTSCNHHRRQT